MTTRTDHNIGTPARKAARRMGMAALPVLALLALAGCAESGNFRPGCPNVGIVRDAGTLRTDGATALMSSLPAMCQYEDSGVNVTAVLTIQATADEGSSVTSVPVEYFVAVTDPERNVLAKQVFATTIPLNGGKGSVQESLVQFIPAPVTVDARWYEVLVGFQLSQDQVEMNRRSNEARR
ncbi:hypothetical protein [Indioceanicola profundi]|uniref:hypothetical protein n=1 Tax=Indioceanicola profundi TaxID=2220096 RepID=UPI0013C48692|nr:hypothetical protein [Indioceanicola profundi]